MLLAFKFVAATFGFTSAPILPVGRHCVRLVGNRLPGNVRDGGSQGGGEAREEIGWKEEGGELASVLLWRGGSERP